MKRFQNLLVHCSLTEADSPVLRFTRKIAELAGSRKVTLLHAAERTEIPEDLAKRSPWLADPIVDSVRKRMEASREEHFSASGDGPDVEIDVRETQPVYAALEAAIQGDADLLIAPAAGLNPTEALRLARKAPCSVAIIPEGEWSTFSRIVVPVDLSDYSRVALETAVAIAARAGIPSIKVVHVASPITGSRRASVPQSMLRDLNQEHAEKKLAAFLAEIHSPVVAIEPVVVEGRVPAHAVLMAAHMHGCDFMILSTRGKDALSAILLGSNAEEIIRNSDVPVLSVKEKGTGSTFLQNLLGNWQ